MSQRRQWPTIWSAWLKHEPIQGRRISWAGGAWRWCQRNPTVASLLLALAIALTTGIVSVTWKWREAESQRTLAEEARDQSETNWQQAEIQR